MQEQGRYCKENTYKVERGKATNTRGVPSTWPYYDDLDRIFGSNPKTMGSLGTNDASVGVEEEFLIQGHIEGDTHGDTHEGWYEAHHGEGSLF